MKNFNISMVSYQEAVAEAVQKAKDYIGNSDNLVMELDGFFVDDVKVISKVRVKVTKPGFQSRTIKVFNV